MKRIVVGFGAIALVALALPVANLMDGREARTAKLVEPIEDPAFRSAAVVMGNKCMDCHATSAPLPLYANFPVASTLIGQDIADGLARLDLSDKLQTPESFTDLDLARMDAVLINHTMPPLRYVALHWNTMLTADDEDALLGWIAQERTRRNKELGVADAFLTEPIPPLSEPVDLDPKKVALGDRLFHDKRLSADNSLSCASCHAKDKGGTDQRRFSIGIDGQEGPINSPTVFNAVYNVRQFWDGRAVDLVDQAAGPVHNPIEMGSNWKEVLAKLEKDAGYVQTFNRLYPDGMTGDNIADAIATFEMSLVTPNSRFDQYLRGDKTALNATELKGYEIFKASCASCHAGPAMGGLSFERMGLKRDYFAARGDIQEVDYGRFNVTQDPRDRHAFKVPTLRNIAVTWPYFHDGSKETLEEAVQDMGHYQLGKTFSDEEVDALVQFLKTLTGEYKGQKLQ